MNLDYRKIHKKCNEQRKLNSEKEAEIKRLNYEIGKLRSQKAKDTPIDERNKKVAARNLLKENNYPTYSDNEEIEVNKEENKDPEKDKDPEIICTGWATNTGFTPVSTPKKVRKPIGRPEDQQNATPYSSGSDSEGTKRMRNGGFKIPRIPPRSPTPKKKIEKKTEESDKDKLIEDLRKQLEEQKKMEELRNPKKVLTQAQKVAIEEANGKGLELQPENHFPVNFQIWHKVVPYLDRLHPMYSTLNLHWTRKGKLLDIPKEHGQIVKENEDTDRYNMARKEPYVTPEGEIKWAIAYGIRPSELNVWYKLDEVYSAFPNWTPTTK